MRLLWAFIISVIIYLFLIGAYLYYFKPLKIIPKKPKDEHIIKIDIRDIPRYVKKIEPKKIIKKKTLPPKKTKKTTKPSESKASTLKKPKPKSKIKIKIKIKPNPPIPTIKKTIFYEPEIVEEIVEIEETVIEEPIWEEEIPFVEEEFIPEAFVEQEPIENEPIAKIVEETPVPKDDFIAEEDMLFIPNPIVDKPNTKITDSLSSLLGQGNITTNAPKKTPLIQKLYGSSFDNFTPIQKKFIVDNLRGIHKITQSTLTRRGYPAGAIAYRTGQEGENVVSFDLHPNGDISNLRLEQKVGYRALDENTLQTIRIAYKDYPYPQETTHIVFYVEYSIFGY